MEMKITTLEQLNEVLERIADHFIAKGDAIEVDLADYLKKTDAANTYALKNQPVTLGTAAQTTEGALWVQWNQYQNRKQ